MISGTAGDQLTYNLNGGIDQSVIIDAAGNAQVIIPSISTAQSMTITSVLSNSCIAPNNVNSFIAILPSTTSVVDTTICDGLNYFGHYQTGTYLDTFPASVGCDSIRTLHLIVIKTPKPNLGPDKVICPGESFPISPGNFSTYLWQDGTTQPVFTVTAPGIYTVTVNSTCGNLADQLVVTRGICDIYFASGFTPDKNGKNDAFKVLTDLSLQEYDLKVFDRWGEIIFHTKEQGKGWDGTLKGVTLDAGLYIWISSFVYNGQKKFMKGTVMLIR
jgi:gliding motility-associated-like protein